MADTKDIFLMADTNTLSTLTWIPIKICYVRIVFARWEILHLVEDLVYINRNLVLVVPPMYARP